MSDNVAQMNEKWETKSCRTIGGRGKSGDLFVTRDNVVMRNLSLNVSTTI